MFIGKVPYSHQIIMITYYAAQLGITLSVVDSYESPEINNHVIQHYHLIDGVKHVSKTLKSLFIKSDNTTTKVE
jgi:hypothetical protein